MTSNYKVVKRIVLVALLGGICFVFGYLYFGAKLAAVFEKVGDRSWKVGDRSLRDQSPDQSPSAGAGPPAPVMQKLQALKRRVADDPKDEEAYSELGNLYFQANKFGEALSYYEKAVQLNGKDIVARNDLALCYHIARREKEAFDQLAAALKIAPRAQHLWLTLGLVNFENGKTVEARKALQHAYSLDPKSEAGHAARAMISSMGTDQKRSSRNWGQVPSGPVP